MDARRNIHRNCIEINEYINRFVSNAKQYLYEIQEDYEIDPDMFLRGQAVFHGDGVKYIQLPIKKASCEIDTILQAINKIHDENEIPYDEIAVIMYQGQYRKKIAGWLDKQYYLQQTLETRLRLEDIPCCRLYSTDAGWQDHFGETGGVRLIKFQSTLGLDFRAAIICGLVPLGEYDGIKNPNWEHLKTNEETYSNAIAATQSCIQNLYVACTRAKEVLLIGDHQTLNVVFKDARFNGWSIGEIFAIDKLLIPNARRDNFEKNPAYFALFEQLMTLAAEITRDIRAASLKRNSLLSNAISQLNETAQQAASAIDQGVSGVQKGLITKKLKEAHAAVSNSTINGDSEQYYQDIAFAELDMLIGKLKGTTKYKALNTIDSLTNTEKKILERVINIVEALDIENSDAVIEAILNNFSAQ